MVCAMTVEKKRLALPVSDSSSSVCCCRLERGEVLAELAVGSLVDLHQPGAVRVRCCLR